MTFTGRCTYPYCKGCSFIFYHSRYAAICNNKNCKEYRCSVYDATEEELMKDD